MQYPGDSKWVVNGHHLLGTDAELAGGCNVECRSPDTLLHTSYRDMEIQCVCTGAVALAYLGLIPVCRLALSWPDAHWDWSCTISQVGWLWISKFGSWMMLQLEFSSKKILRFVSSAAVVVFVVVCIVLFPPFAPDLR